jgi:molybdopterin adenylyltransferase
VTPEATKAVIEKEAPGLTEMMRMKTLSKTKYASLSRSVAGIRKETLIVNFPGNPKGVQECFDVVQPVLSHALALIKGKDVH